MDKLLNPPPEVLSVLILEVVPLVGVRLHGEGEEVEAGEVGDEDRIPAVPPIVSIRNLSNKESFIAFFIFKQIFEYSPYFQKIFLNRPFLKIRWHVQH